MIHNKALYRKNFSTNYQLRFPGLLLLLDLELLPERHGVLDLRHVRKVRRVGDTQASEKNIIRV